MSDAPTNGTGSYLGWLPAANLHENSADDPVERNLQMIAAHLVWGAVAGALLDAMSSDQR
jgi:hypothetical protein